MTPRPQVYSNEPLPLNPYTPHSQSGWHNAYEAALKLERTHEIRGRVLGYLLLEAMDDDARDYVATGINKFEPGVNGTTLYDLAQIYIEHFLFFFYHQEGGPPYTFICDHHHQDWSDSRTGQMHPWDDVPRPRLWKLDLPDTDPTPHTLTESRHAVLQRDGKRCIISRDYDYDLWCAGLRRRLKQGDSETDVFEKWTRENGSSPKAGCPTHIFPPFALSDEGESEERERRRYTFQTIDIVRGYGHIDVMAELKPSRGHRLSNVMNMDPNNRARFTHQYMRLEPASASPADLDNTYYTESVLHRRCWHHTRHLVTLTTTDDRLELPDPRYLRLRATVCRISCLSGLYRCMGQICEEWLTDSW